MSYISIQPHKKAPKKKPLNLFDLLVMVVSVVYPLSAIPQAISVFQGNTEGVAALSWIFFFVCAALFLIYGIKRKVLPMVISNSIWVVMDSLVVAGILIQ